MQIALNPGWRGLRAAGPQPWLTELVLAAWVVVSILILCLLLLPGAKRSQNTRSRSQAMTWSVTRETRAQQSSCDGDHSWV